MIATKELLALMQADCEPALQWMGQNDMWGQNWTTIRSELVRQIESAELDESIVTYDEASRWVRFWDDRTKDPTALRAGGSVIELDETKVHTGDNRFSGLTISEATRFTNSERNRRYQNRLERIAVCKVNRGYNTLQMLPIKRFAQLRRDGEYSVHDPLTGKTVFVYGKEAVVDLVNSIYAKLPFPTRKYRKIRDAEGFEAWEEF